MSQKITDGTTSGITTPTDYGVWGDTNGGFGVAGTSSGSFGVYGESIDATGVYGTSNNGQGVVGISNITEGVFGMSNNDTGVFGGTGTRGGYAGVLGWSVDGVGVIGTSSNKEGVHGYNSNPVRFGNRPGVWGDGDAEDGVWGISKNGNGLYAWTGGNPTTAYAAWLDGQVYIGGPLIKPGGSFQIDHPLDPANKYLHHAFVESPDMKNIYDGVVVLDGEGQAEVEFPAWFHALNNEFRYQLTPIGASGPGLHIEQEIANNRFRIAGGAPGMKVSWQVTGIRTDPWAKAHRIQVELEKPPEQRGRYLHPELYNEPEEKAIDWALRSAARAKPRTEKDPRKRIEKLEQIRKPSSGEKKNTKLAARSSKKPPKRGK